MGKALNRPPELMASVNELELPIVQALSQFKFSNEI
jgi:hypothetical protein